MYPFSGIHTYKEKANMYLNKNRKANKSEQVPSCDI